MEVSSSPYSQQVWKAVAFLAALVSFCYIVYDDLDSKVGDVGRFCGLIMLLTLSGMSTIKLFDVRQPLKWIYDHQILILARHGSPNEKDGMEMISPYQSTPASQNNARDVTRAEAKERKAKKRERKVQGGNSIKKEISLVIGFRDSKSDQTSQFVLKLRCSIKELLNLRK